MAPTKRGARGLESDVVSVGLSGRVLKVTPGTSNFAHMGIVDTELRRKEAYSEWARVFARPLR